MTVTPFTRVPNAILEAIQSDDMSKIEAKLTLALARETYGRQQDDARLTWDDMQALAGISRSSLNIAIDLVEQRGFFIRARRSAWLATIPNSSMNSTKIEPNSGSNSTKIVLDDSTKIEPSSIREKKDPNGSKKKNTTPTPPPDPTLAEMVNALVDATGMSAHLNWTKLSDLARELLGGGYTAGQVAQVYGPAGWWYTCDWRGQKGQRPGVTAVRETIRLGAAWNGQIPARASPAAANGGQVTRAEAAALEYAAMKESFFQE